MSKKAPINAFQASEQYGVGHHALRRLMMENLTPVVEYPYGKGVQRMYDPDQVRDLVHEHWDFGAPPKPPTKTEAADSGDVANLLASISRSQNILTHAVDELREMVEQMGAKQTEQARVFFNSLQAANNKLDAIVSELGVKT